MEKYAWPTTPWTEIRRARLDDGGPGRAAVDRLLELYYVPVQRFFQRALGVSESDVGDATHDLFAKLLERDFAGSITHETSFRGFLKLLCRRHRASSMAARAVSDRVLQKLMSQEDEAAIDRAIDDELRRFYVEEAMRRVRDELLRRGREDTLAIFEARTRFDGSRPEEYRSLARRFGMKLYDVRNRLWSARRIFRRALLRIAGERVEDPREELRELGLLRYVRGDDDAEPSPDRP
jgi:hypothetical protein